MKKGTPNPHTAKWNKKISDGVKRQHAEGRGSKLGFSRAAQQKGVAVRLGKSLTPQHKEKLRNAKLGRKLSVEHRLKMSLSKKGVTPTNVLRGDFKGDKNWNWKGGITPESMRIRNSRPQKTWGRVVFLRDDFTCKVCGVRGVDLHADHIKPFAYFPELRLLLENGRTLCVPCHKKTDTYMGRATKKYGK